MNAGFLSGIFASSVLGSIHCAGMCGPFVAFFAGGRAGLWPHLAYHGQRALMYTALGALGGAFGSGVNELWRETTGLQVAALLASVLTILWGLTALFPGTHFGRLLRFLPQGGAGRLVKLGRRAPTTRAFLLGTFTPLLPCGMLYAFVTLAAGTGHIAHGALTMFVFFLGTLPGLLGLGSLSATLGRWLGARLPRLLGASLVAIGLWGLYERGPALYRGALGEEHHACHGR